MVLALVLCSLMLAGVEVAKLFSLTDVIMMDELETQRPGPNAEDAQMNLIKKEFAWLNNNGAVFMKMRPSMLDDTYLIDGAHGMVATEDIKMGDVLGKIPSKMFFSVENALKMNKEKSSSLEAMLDCGKEALLNPSDLVRLCLLHEIRNQKLSKASSFWEPWFQVLDTEDPFPAVLAQYSLVDSSPLMQASQEVINFQRLNWQKSLTTFANKCPQFAHLLETDDWKLAAFLFEKHGRRSGGGDKKGQHTMLVPGMDMFQQRFGHTAWGYTPLDKSVTIIALQDIKKDSQIFIDGVVNKKNMIGRLQHNLSPTSLSWMGVITLPETPPVLSDQDQSRFFYSPIAPRNTTEGRLWYYTVTLTAPPLELLNTVRARHVNRVRDGKITATEAEIIVLTETINIITSSIRNSTKEPNSDLRSLRRWLSLNREPNLERRAVVVRVMQLQVLTHNALLLGMLKTDLEKKISKTQKVGTMGLQQQRSDHHVIISQYRLTFGLSLVAIRLAGINYVRKSLGKREIQLPDGHFLSTFPSNLINTLSGISDVEDLLQQMQPPHKGTEDTILNMLRCDVLSLLSRSMQQKDHAMTDQLLRLGPSVVSPNALFSQGLSSRRRDSLLGHRLLHAAVMEADPQIVRSLLFYGASTKSKTLLPEEGGDVALHFASKLQTTTFTSLEIMQLLLDADTASEASLSGTGFVRLADVERYP
eukprot:TRINITY_DN37185_c0_g1_i1.p1 TRINITY_DN37185_c0_g1~~TRINITY_DN37185_c0_g1_i1.p1  ORF type:complete len:701 (+),score=127.95 TRINITY_DN37185_c0_g1_i1:74-2176(+)